MPEEYLMCVKESMKGGMSEDDAQERCAIAYYKKHGITVTEAARREGKKSELVVEGDMMKIYTSFTPTFTKGDVEEECKVGGYITTDTIDSQGEIIDKEASYEAAEEWAKIGNIREMHQPSAVGKSMWMEKRDRGVYVEAKIVDPVAKLKVREGVYTMFSVGGKVLKRDGNKIIKYRMNEVSLVDRGANPDASFLVLKVDADSSPKESVEGGMMEDKKTPSQQAATSPEVIAKAEYDKVETELNSARNRIVELEKEVEERRKEETVKAVLAKAIAELQPDQKNIKEEKPEMNQMDVLKSTLQKMSSGEMMALMLKLKEEG